MRVRKASIDELALGIIILWYGTYAYARSFDITGITGRQWTWFLVAYILARLLISPTSITVKARAPYSIMLWSACFILFLVVGYLKSSQSEAATSALATWLGTAFLFVGLIVLYSKCASLRYTQIAFLLSALLGSALVIYDFLDPTFSRVYGRGSGIYENPNIAGYFIVMAMLAARPILPRKLATLFIVFCGIGVLVTFSRGSWILWGVAVSTLGWVQSSMPIQRRALMAAAGGIIGIGVLILLFNGTIGGLLINTPLEEYLNSNSIQRLQAPGSRDQFADGSATSRTEMILSGFSAGWDAPFAGHGLASSREYSSIWPYTLGPHNMYVLFWVEGGFWGIALYLWLALMLFRGSKGAGRIMALLFVIEGIFTYNLLDGPGRVLFLAYIVTHGTRYPTNETTRAAMAGNPPVGHLLQKHISP